MEKQKKKINPRSFPTHAIFARTGESYGYENSRLSKRPSRSSCLFDVEVFFLPQRLDKTLLKSIFIWW